MYIFNLHHIQAVTESSIFLNKYFATRLYTSLAFIVYAYMLVRHVNSNSNVKLPTPDWCPPLISIVAVLMLYYTGYNELALYSNYAPFCKIAYYMAFATVLSFILTYNKTINKLIFNTIVILWVIGFLYYWLLPGYHYNADINLQINSQKLFLYWIAFACLCGLFVNTISNFYKRISAKSENGRNSMWLFNIIIMITISIAATDALKQLAASNKLSINIEAMLTVLWTLSAFIQMWLGMKLKYKTLRLISLTLLTIVIGKLFLFDIVNASQGVKIIAFVVLGVVLLILSFLYQKLKKILFDNDEEQDVRF
jgi:hypothetical protein